MNPIARKTDVPSNNRISTKPQQLTNATSSTSGLSRADAFALRVFARAKKPGEFDLRQALPPSPNGQSSNELFPLQPKILFPANGTPTGNPFV